ncbi:putative porin [Flavobacterium sp.]|uniref:putative porin n=1 Tax=Flavobacterium sp. TaxID=239 RepID=UPI0038FC327C
MPNKLSSPMRIFLFLFVFALPMVLFSQKKDFKNKANTPNSDSNSSYIRQTDSVVSKPKPKVATLDLYRFISLERDTTYIDTSLTIQKEYSHNYLRRDTFGLIAFPNEGQTYNTLHNNLADLSPYPEFGFKAKHFNFIEANQIRYCSVATPVTELYFKSVMKQGQSADSFLSLNITPRFNFSIAYKGLRSEGRYINQLSSSGNFRFTTSYNSKNQRYFANAHFTAQDILNEENGGITTIDDFESEDISFDNRERLEVYLTNAKSYLKGKRFFIDHHFRINPTKGTTNLYLSHQFNYEHKYFEYNQATVASTVGSTTLNRFGNSYLTSGINDQTRYNKTHNIVGITYENTLLGKFKFFAEDFKTNYYYNKILIRSNGIIPASLNQNINTVGGQYDYESQKWKGRFLYTRSLGNESLSNLDATLFYSFNDESQLSFGYQNINSMPNNNFELYQSSYVNYNWSNSFKNEKNNIISANLNSPLFNASLQLAKMDDHLYFADTSTDTSIQLVSPEQYDKTINYFSFKINKEFRFGKFALDNTVLYQKVEQQDFILNVPQLVTRNSLYYSGYMFKKALYLQTGFVFNYFTNYYANDYNPVIGEFFVQNRKEIGNYPNIDFFVNARIQRTRIYFKAEHFNSSLTGNNFYAAPNNPYRDFMIRFGVVWNFFE